MGLCTTNGAKADLHAAICTIIAAVARFILASRPFAAGMPAIAVASCSFDSTKRVSDVALRMSDLPKRTFDDAFGVINSEKRAIVGKKCESVGAFGSTAFGKCESTFPARCRCVPSKLDLAQFNVHLFPANGHLSPADAHRAPAIVRLASSNAHIAPSSAH